MSTAPSRAAAPFTLSLDAARRIWLSAQRLDHSAPFGGGPEATRHAVEHLGYVQIDTINVIERCHHHILHTRIPGYQRAHLATAQTIDKSVFEYWTHALSYVPTRDLHFFLPDMDQHRCAPNRFYANVTRADLRKVLNRIRTDGPLTIRDIDDDVLVEKDHPWASRKPSKRALQLAFYAGDVTIRERVGMLKSYELSERHFGWSKRPKPAAETAVLGYLLQRALRAQGLISVESVCYLAPRRKAPMRALIERRVRARQLVPVQVAGLTHVEHWVLPTTLDRNLEPMHGMVHILSPFDPFIIQRKRLQQLLGYEHRFEAYVPKDRRVLGYFALPVLVDETIVAAIDLKTDRTARRLLVQQWTWMGRQRSRELKRRIENELSRFEAFQLA